VLQLDFLNFGEGFYLMAFINLWQRLGGWWWCGFVSRSQEMMANSPWWHRKDGFLSMNHDWHQMLGFKSKGLNPEQENINVKVHGFQREMSESGITCFHRAPWESSGVYLYGS
jgi:hypothetical protein